MSGHSAIPWHITVGGTYAFECGNVRYGLDCDYRDYTKAEAKRIVTLNRAAQFWGAPG